MNPASWPTSCDLWQSDIEEGLTHIICHPLSGRISLVGCFAVKVSSNSLRSLGCRCKRCCRCRWKAQALVDAGVRKGSTSRELSDLREARKRIKELEDELRLVKDACEIFDSLAVVDPKEGRPSR